MNPLRFADIVVAILMGMVATMLYSCSSSDIPLRELSEIDSIGIDRPDSALALIERFDTRKLATPADSAQFNLIRAEIRDKNYFSDTIDTPIRQSVRFYRKSNDKYNLMRSLFYQGEILRNKGQLGDALLAEMEAADAFQSYDKTVPLDWVYGKKIFTGISEIYENTGDRVQKMEYAKKAYEMAAKSDSTPFINDATLWYAATLSENSQVHGSVALLKKLLGQAHTSGDTALVMETASHLGNAYLWDRNFREARHYLSFPILLGKDSAMTDRDINFLLWSMIEDNAPLDSIKFIRETIGSSIPDEDLRYEYHIALNDYQSAFYAIQNEHHWLNDEIVRFSKSNASSLLANNLKLKREAALNEAHFQRLLNITITILVTLITFCGILFVRFKLKEKSKRIRELVDQVGILRADLNKTSEINSSIKNNSDSVSHHSPILTEMLCHLDSLYSEYYRLPSNEKDGSALVKSMSKTVNLFRSDDSLLESLENEINIETDNLLTNLYSNRNKLNDNQRRLVVYLYFNLSVEAVCTLLDITPSIYYNRKSRLKTNISSFSSPRRKELIDLLFYKDSHTSS